MQAVEKVEDRSLLPTMTPTSPPTPPHPTSHHLGKRHYYTCGDEILSWESSWYTEGFFTSLRASYDSAASTGPVNPPLSIIETVSRCAAALSAESTTAVGLLTTDVVSIYTSDRRTSTTTVREVTTSPRSPHVASSTINSASATSSISFVATTTMIAATTTRTMEGVSTTTSVSIGSAVDPMSSNTCAGGWDWQDWGVVAGLGSGLIVGSALWLLWGLLRGRMPVLFSPRSWFVPSDSRSSANWSLTAFLLPFLHMPSIGSSYGGATLHLLFTTLKLAAITSLLALAGIFPLLLVDVPCLAQTAPNNNLGGRLGTLTDLSLLRLLDALDPSPESSATSDALRLLVQSNVRKNTRALSSTIAPTISSARVRLIIVLVILAILAIGGSLFTIARAYAALASARMTYHEKTCQWLDMVFISSKDATSWNGMSEERLRRSLKDWSKSVADEKDEDDQIGVIGVFAVPDIVDLTEKVKQRERALSQLEQAEAQYISSFHLTQTRSKGNHLEPVWWTSDVRPNQEHHSSALQKRASPPKDFVAPKAFYHISSAPQPASHGNLDVPIPASLGSSTAETRFHEINRDSAMFGGRFQLGQRIKLNEHGQYVPDPSPESEQTHPFGSGSLESHNTSVEGDSNGPRPGAEGHAPSSQDNPTPHTGEVVREIPADLPTSRSTDDLASQLRSGSSKRPNLRTFTPSGRNSGQAPYDVAHWYTDIRQSRTRFKEFNEEVERLQQATFSDIASGREMRGWVLVGKRARWLPFAQVIEGGTKEDILWANAGAKGNDMVFWTKVIILGICLCVAMAPVFALTVGTAPGFAHYLGLFKPLATSDGFGSAVVEGLVPAVALSLAVSIAIYAVTRFSKQVRCISQTHQEMLAYKATFWLLLSTTAIWLILVIALEFAVQGFVTNVQEARTIGDGAIFSTWFVFVLLLNSAFVLPVLYLLQPKRLIRYICTRKKAITPRQKYRLTVPPSYDPSVALAPCLLAVFYAFTLPFIFPLLALPILVLLYLAFVANRYMVDHVFVDSNSSFVGISIGLWTIRRFGWLLVSQPALYGLLMLSRREWAMGGASLAVSVIAVLLSELLTVVRYPSPAQKRLSIRTRKALDQLSSEMTRTIDDQQPSPRQPRYSDLSLLHRVTALLPGYSRLPPDCPLPFSTDLIDDITETDRASLAKPGLSSAPERQMERNKGLVYPPEMMADFPLIWLPFDEAGVAEAEMMDLQIHHCLGAIVDPQPNPPSNAEDRRMQREEEGDRLQRRRGKRPTAAGREVESPLLE